MNDQDLKLLSEEIEHTKDLLGKKFEDYAHDIINESDFQDALRSSIKFLTYKKETLRLKKERLAMRLQITSKDIFKCLNEAFIRYDAAHTVASQTNRHSTREKIERCYQKVQECCVSLMQIARFIAGYTEYQRIKTLFIKLEEMIRSERLLEQLTIRTTALLLSQVDEFWSRSLYEEGKIVSQICRRRLSDLSRQESDADKRKGFDNRLEKIGQISERGARFAARPEIITAEDLLIVRNLIEEGFLCLTERLMNDLEDALRQCRIFFEQFEAYQIFVNDENLPAISVDELRLSIFESGWEFATCKLVKTMLETSMRKLTYLNFQVPDADRPLPK